MLARFGRRRLPWSTVTSTADTLELLALDSHMAVGGLGRMFVVATLQPPTRASVKRFRGVVAAYHERVGERLLGVVIPASPRPRLDADGREMILEIWSDMVGRMDGCAVWILRRSFAGALQRSLVTGLLLVRPVPIESGVASNAADAVAVLERAEPSTTPNQRAVWTSALERFASEHTSFSS